MRVKNGDQFLNIDMSKLQPFLQVDNQKHVSRDEMEKTATYNWVDKKKHSFNFASLEAINFTLNLLGIDKKDVTIDLELEGN